MLSRRSAGRRQSAGDDGVSPPAAFGSVEFAQLFDLLRQPPARASTLAGNPPAPFYLLGRRSAASAPCVPRRRSPRRAASESGFSTPASPCVTGETGCGRAFAGRLFKRAGATHR
ncbi:hypothetical protein M8494_11260 [Serratia ureilytica]